MAKKKQTEPTAAKETKKTPATNWSPAGATGSIAPSASKTDSLSGEVQSFLSKRDELADKLAREIEATEKKLAELKRSAALLFPEKYSAGHTPPESPSMDG